MILSSKARLLVIRVSDIVRVGIGVAVREGAPKPDISSVDAFKSMLLSVKSFTYAPEGATGSILPRCSIALGSPSR